MTAVTARQSFTDDVIVPPGSGAKSIISAAAIEQRQLNSSTLGSNDVYVQTTVTTDKGDIMMETAASRLPDS